MITYPLLGKCGRLGNQLWQLASTIGIARSRGEEVSFPDWPYRPYFTVPDEFFTGAEGTDASTLVPHLDPRCAIYLQDYGLWSGIVDEIREYLMPTDLAVDRILQHEEYVELIKQDVLAIHVRRGDNALDPGTPNKYLYHPMRSEQYYRNAIDTFPLDMPVVVFSDDQAWCQENMPRILERECYFFTDGAPHPKEHEAEYVTTPVTDWIDLVAMACADHHIISNSTYAWWGAFLSGNPHPIYPSNWLGKNLDYIDTSKMFPPDWVEINDPTVVGG